MLKSLHHLNEPPVSGRVSEAPYLVEESKADDLVLSLQDAARIFHYLFVHVLWGLAGVVEAG